MKWYFLIPACFLLMGCEVSEITQPEACMEVFNSTIGEMLTEPYSAMINQTINVTSCNHAQLYAFYPGTESKLWQGEVTPENQGYSSSNGNFSISYPAPGEYQMTLIVTNRGEDPMEYKRDIVSSSMTISDNNAELVTFDIRLTSGTVLEGIPQGSHFIFTITEGISVSSVVPLFKTGTDYSTVELNGEIIQSGVSRVTLLQNSTVTVTAYDGTQKEYKIIINTV